MFIKATGGGGQSKASRLWHVNTPVRLGALKMHLSCALLMPHQPQVWTHPKLLSKACCSKSSCLSSRANLHIWHIYKYVRCLVACCKLSFLLPAPTLKVYLSFCPPSLPYPEEMHPPKSSSFLLTNLHLEATAFCNIYLFALAMPAFIDFYVAMSYRRMAYFRLGRLKIISLLHLKVHLSFDG